MLNSNRRQRRKKNGFAPRASSYEQPGSTDRSKLAARSPKPASEEPMALIDARPAPAKPRVARVADPCVMVIFGFSGDLTRRKLIPALYNLASQQLLSRDFAMIGLGRSAMSDEDARKKATEDFKQFASGPIDQKIWDDFV